MRKLGVGNRFHPEKYFQDPIRRRLKKPYRGPENRVKEMKRRADPQANAERLADCKPLGGYLPENNMKISDDAETDGK
jgi:hypothetical protein